MDELLRSDLPWQMKAAMCLGSGLVVAVSILIIPKRTLARIGPYVGGPDGVTIIRFAMFWCGVPVYFFVSPFTGLQLIVASCSLDVTDGRMAKAYAELGIARSARDLAFGEKADPLADKLTAPVLMILLAYLGALSKWPVIAVVAIDFIGTVIREAPFMNKVRATAVGKIKTLLQDFTCLCCMPVLQGWVTETTVQDVIAWIAVVFGIGSILSRSWKRFGKAAESADPYFTHRDL